MIIDFLKQHGDYCDDKYFKDLTTLRMGGHIKHFVVPNSIEDVKEIIAYLKLNKISFKVLGNGSNLICGESEYDGVVISLKKLNTYEIENDSLYVEAGVNIPGLAKALAKQGYSCLEFASGIPGSLGGLVYMNAGAYKVDMSNVVVDVEILKDDEIVWYDNAQMEFAYRHSIMQEHPHWVVLAAHLHLTKGDPKQIEDLMADRLRRRLSTQPLDSPSAGSTFRNPSEVFSWQLIDGIGYRGHNENGVCVSPKHSNFIVNNGGGQAQDYLKIVYEIIDKVKEKYGIKLTMEVEKFNC